MKTRYFSRASLALAISFLTAPLIAAEQPVEGPIVLFLGQPKLELQQLFTGGRLPNVVVATDGTVLATHGATGGPGDWWKKGLQVRRSEDGGKTWSEPIAIANPGWQGGGLTVDETRGDVLAFAEDNYIGFYQDAKLTVFRSTDHGMTWKAQAETIIHKDCNGIVPAMSMAGHGITLLCGKHKGRLLRPTRNYAGGDRSSEWHKMYTNAIYSDDGGKTWKNLAISKVLPDGTRAQGSNGCHGGLVRLPARA